MAASQKRCHMAICVQTRHVAALRGLTRAYQPKMDLDRGSVSTSILGTVGPKMSTLSLRQESVSALVTVSLETHRLCSRTLPTLMSSHPITSLVAPVPRG